MNFWLFLICIGRFALACPFMVFSAALPQTLGRWGMSGGDAGLIQFLITIAFGTSLVASSLFVDRVGAKRLLLAHMFASAIAGLLFGFFARGFASAATLSVLLGLALGGTYGPVLVLIVEAVPARARGTAIGWNFAATSLGYAVTLAGTAVILARWSYESAFIIAGALPCVGLAAVLAATRSQPNVARPGAARPRLLSTLLDPRARLLTVGYTFHSWELLAIWGWAPAFLAVALGAAGFADAAALGPALATGLHLAGVAASVTAGALSDRLGRRLVMIALAATSAIAGAVMGFTIGLPVGITIVLVVIAGFAAIADSPVMTTALSESVPPAQLGGALAIRSFTGFSFGALGPLSFGLVLDATSAWGPMSWGFAFMSGALAGLVATVAAWRLPPPAPPRPAGADSRA